MKRKKMTPSTPGAHRHTPPKARRHTAAQTSAKSAPAKTRHSRRSGTDPVDDAEDSRASEKSLTSVKKAGEKTKSKKSVKKAGSRKTKSMPPKLTPTKFKRTKYPPLAPPPLRHEVPKEVLELDNVTFALLLSSIADRLQFVEENPFKVIAYRNAAHNIYFTHLSLVEEWLQGRLQEFPGIGKSISRKIDEYCRTGTCEFLEELKAKVPDGVVDMIHVRTLGPKRVKRIWHDLHITTLDQLETALDDGSLEQLPGFGAKTVANIRKGLEARKRLREGGKKPLGEVLPLARKLVAQLRGSPLVERAEYCGSVRRGVELVKDVDLLVVSEHPEKVIEQFTHFPEVVAVWTKGAHRASAELEAGLRCDLRVIEARSFGTAYQYFTGSREHNIKLRLLAKKRGLHLSEYSLVNDKTRRTTYFATEKEVYNALGMQFIPPELRENLGEIQLAQKQELPTDLITQEDLHGDLHLHTTWSDGHGDVKEMANAALKLGHEYIAVTDHTSGIGFQRRGHKKSTPRLTRAQLHSQKAVIDRLNASLDGALTVLYGAEVEVKPDGTLDIEPELLPEFDFVQASIHSQLDLPRDAMTQRAVRAIQNPYVDVFSHPSGRRLTEREESHYDWPALFQTAAKHDVALEINCQPARLDLSAIHARQAVEAGCLVTISSDAHSTRALQWLQLGVLTARRAYIRKTQVVNAWPLQRVKAWLQKRRAKLSK